MVRLVLGLSAIDRLQIRKSLRTNQTPGTEPRFAQGASQPRGRGRPETSKPSTAFERLTVFHRTGTNRHTKL